MSSSRLIPELSAAKARMDLFMLESYVRNFWSEEVDKEYGQFSSAGVDNNESANSFLKN